MRIKEYFLNHLTPPFQETFLKKINTDVREVTL